MKCYKPRRVVLDAKTLLAKERQRKVKRRGREAESKTELTASLGDMAIHSEWVG